MRFTWGIAAAGLLAVVWAFASTDGGRAQTTAVPDAVTNLSATPDATNSGREIDLSWTAPADNGADITGYTLQRKIRFRNYTNVSTTISATSTSYSDTGVSPVTTYTYRIRASNSVGDADWSNEPEATTDAAPPDAVTDLTATPATSTMALAWTTPAPNGGAVEGYTLQRKSGSGNYADVSPGPSTGDTAYSDTGLTPVTTYTYRIRATNYAGDAEWSNEPSATTAAAVPDAVTDLSATKDATNGATEIDLSWTAPAANGADISSYTLQRKAGSGDYADVSPGPSVGDTTYSDTGLTPGTTYTYRIRAANSAGSAAWSNEPTETTDAGVPDAVTDLAAAKDATNGAREIDLTWTAPAANGEAISSYRLERKAGSGTYAAVSSGPSAGDTTYSDTGLTPGTTYTYRIRASNSVGDAEWSNEPSETTDAAAPEAPAAVTDLSATRDGTFGSTEIDLSWTAPADNGSPITGYTLQRKSISGRYSDVSTNIAAGATAYSDTGLEPSTSYTYRIRAANSVGNAAWSNEATASTRAPNRSDPVSEVFDLRGEQLGGSATAGPTGTRLRWVRATGDDDLYHVFSSTDGGRRWSRIGAILPPFDLETWDLFRSNLAHGHTYLYRVRAFSYTHREGPLEYAETTVGAPAAGTLSAPTISNASVVLNWTASNRVFGNPITGFRVERRTGFPQPWDLLTTTASTTTTFTDDTAAGYNTYRYRIRAVNSVGVGDATRQQAVTLGAGRPEVPTGLSATASGQTSIDLAWTAPNSTTTSYTLQRKSGSGSYETTTTSIAAGATTYTDTGLTHATAYTYRIRAANSYGGGGWSNEASATTDSAVPEAVTDLSATNDGATEIGLSWTAPADNGSPITGYTLQRKSGSENYKDIATTTIAASATTYSDTGLTPGTEYTYRIRAKNFAGDGAWSNEASATPAAVPAAVTDLSAAAATSDPHHLTEPHRSVDLTWSAPSANGAAITGYTLQRKTGGGNYEEIATSTPIAASATSYTDSGLTDGTEYTYRIRAANSIGDADWSNESSTTTLTAHVPSAVTDLSAAKDATNGSTEIDLTWTAPAANGAAITAYTLQRKSGAGNYATTTMSIAGSATTYSDTGLTPATEYTYRIHATNSAGDAAWSNESTATTAAAAPAAVTDLAAAVGTTYGATEIDLTWTTPAANGADITGYTLQRKAGSGNYAGLSTAISATSTSYSDTGLTPGTAYTYRIRATNSEGDAMWSNTPSATTQSGAVPSAITDLSATSTSSTAIRLTWTAPAHNGAPITGYTVRSIPDLTTIASGVTDTSYSDTGLTPGVEHGYQVHATNAVGDGVSSNVARATTDAAAPAAVADLLAAKDATNGSTEIDLSWSTPYDLGAPISGYTLQRKAGSGNYADLSTAISATSTTYSDTGLTPGTTYTYRIRAKNSEGDAAWSNEASATTDATAPDAVTDLTATPATSTMALAWTAPAFDGGADITGYTLQRKRGSGNYSNVSTSISATSTTYTDTGLTPWTTYTYRIRATNSADDADWSNTPSAETDQAVPDAITNLRATKQGARSIRLAWNTPLSNGRNFSGYRLERKAGSGDYTLAASPGAGATIYDDTGLTPGTTYTYRIRGANAIGSAEWSNEDSATTDAAAPAAVADLSATTNGARGVNLSWTAPAAHGEAITGYTLQRKAGSGAYSNVSTSIAAGATTYSDTGLTPATAYTYRIRATNSVGDAGWSNTPSATTAAAAPDTVSDLVATAVSSTEIDLTWSAPAANGADITGYTIQSISTDRPVWRFLSVAASATSTSYTGLRPATLHSFRIRAANSVGNGEWTSYVSATTRDAPPAAVSNLSAIKDATNSGREIDLSWTTPFDNGKAITGYTLQRKSGSGNYADIATSTIAAGATTYTDTDVTPGGTYTYRIRAKNSGGDAAWSNEASETTDTLAPDAITDLTATKDGGRRVDLTWSAPAANGAAISGYTLQRKVGSGSFAEVSTVITATSTSYSDTVTPGMTYTYRLRAVNSVGNADWSNEPSATTDTLAPDAITDLTATPTASDPHRSVDLVFTTPADNGAAISRYSVRRRPQNSEIPPVWNLVDPWIAVVDGSKTTITMTGTIEPGTGYRFDIFVRNSVGDSTGSNVASVTTEATAAPDAITDLSATSTSARGIDLSWSTPDANGEPISGYTLQRKAGAGDYEDIATTTIAASVTAYSDTGLTPATEYTYRLRARNSRGSAEWSNEPSETTPAAVPDAITDLVAAKDVTNGATEIDLTWTAPAANGAPITGYTLRRQRQGITFDTVSSGITTTSYSDTGLTPATEYTYYVYATNSVGDAEWSDVASATTDDDAPARITDLYATSTSSTGIDLTWTTPAAHGQPITGYTLQRSSGGGSYEDIATTTIAAGDTTYSDTGLTPATEYTYRLRATNSIGDAAWSNDSSATTNNAAPGVVGDLAAEGLTSDPYRSVALTWSAPDAHGAALTGYRLERKTGGGSYEEIATSTPIAAGATSYTDTGLTAGTMYTYRIRAKNSVGDAAWSNAATVTTTSVGAPAAITDLSAAKDATNGATEIDLTWTAPADSGQPILSYTLQRKAGTGNYADVSMAIAAGATTYSDTGLTPGTTYTYRIRAANTVGDAPWSNQPRATTDNAAPAAVSDLSAAKDATNGATEIDLAWTAPVAHGAAITGYTLQRKAGAGNYTDVSTAISATSTTYSDTGLTPGTTYTYRIRARNSEGNAEWSNEPDETTDATVPDAVTGLSATAASSTAISLSWTAPNAHGEAISGYRLERKAGSDSFALVSSSIAGGATTYTDTGLTPATMYTYRIRAVNSEGNGAWSNEPSATTDNAAPAAVSDLRAAKDATNPTSTINLAWTAPAAHGAAITGYRLERKRSLGSYAVVSPGPSAGDTTYTDAGLADGWQYTYRIRAVNSVGNGDWSNEPSETTDYAPPAAITDLSAAAATSTEISLSWTAPVSSTAISGYTLQRKSGSGSYANVSTTIAAGATSYTDTGLTPATTYTYRIRAVNSVGDAAWSNQPSAKTNNAAPDAVEDLAAAKDATNGATQIRLTWTAPNNNGAAITSYTIQRISDDRPTWTELPPISGTLTSYLDTGLTPGNEHSYNIRATNSVGDAEWSNFALETTDNAPPATVTDLSATATSSTEIVLSWTAPAAHGEDITGYTLQRKSGSGNYKDIATTTIAASATSYSDTGLTPATEYTYRIRAKNSVGDADWSNQPSATTDNAAPAAITDLSATAASSVAVNLSWTAPAAHGEAITGYRLERKAGTGNYGLVSSTIAAGATTYSDTGLTPATAYTYRLRAANSIGDAEWSNEAPETTPAPGAPEPVSDLSATWDATNGGTDIDLSWTAPNNNGSAITGYRLERKAGTGNYGLVSSTISATSTTYTDTGLTPATQYTYRISARNSVGNAAWSNESSAMTGTAAPAAVSNLSAAPDGTNGSTEIDLTWTAPSDNGEAITGYTLQRKADPGSFTLVSSTIAAGATSYSDTGLTPATTYTYRIRAVNSIGDAGWSNEPTATTDNAAPAAVSDLSATKDGAREIDLSWTAPAAHGQPIQRYTLQRKTGSGIYTDVSTAISATSTSYSDTSLTPATTYTYRIRAVNSVGNADWSNEDDATTDAAAPAAVSNLSATKLDSTRISLSWSAPNTNGAPIIDYAIERKAGSGNYARVATRLASAIRYTDTGLTPGTQYTYRIRARNSVGSAEWSNEPSATTDATAPARITGLSAAEDATNGSTQINLSWTAPAANGEAISSYTLRRKTGSGDYADIATSTIAAGDTSYSDTGLTPATTYTYQIRAVNSVGNADWSNEADATTDAAPPDAITDLAATKDATNGSTEIDLSWTTPAANGAAISSYTIERKAGPGSFTQLSGSPGPAATSYRDTGLTPGTTYTYRLRAWNTQGAGAWSNEADATTDATAPARITDLVATKDATNGAREIDLSWTAPAANGAAISGYTLQRKSGSLSYEVIATTTIAVSATSYTDTGLTPGTAYTYRIRAANSVGNADWSNEDDATTDAAAPAAITDLDATAASSVAIRLTWSAPAAHGAAINAYRLERKAGSGSYAPVSPAPSVGDTTYTDTGLTPSATYTYRLRAANSEGDAEWSNEEPETTPAPGAPEPVSDLVAAKDATNGSTEIDLTWTAPADNGAAISGYRLERKAGPGSYVVASSTIDAAATSYSDTGLTPGTAYTYRIHATNSAGDGAWSTGSSATTDNAAPAAVTDLDATPDATNGSTEIDLSWTAPAAHGAAISGYRLERKEGSGPYTLVSASIAAGATSYSDTGLTPGTTYTYRIRAANSEGSADWSNEDDATTENAAPARITDLSASVASSTAIRLTWTTPAAHGAAISSYRLERKAGPGSFALATTTTIEVTATSWLDTGLTPGTTYTYRLRAANSVGDAEWSNESGVIARDPAPPAAVTNLSATPDATNGSTEIDLSWTKPDDNGQPITSYTLQRKSGSGNYADVSPGPSAGDTSYSDTGLTAGTAYTYRIRAANSAGDGEWSNEASATTQGGGGGGGGGAFFLPPTGPAPPPAAPTTNVIALEPAALSFTVRQGGGNPSAKTFAVWNTKFRGMVFKVSENVRWLTSTLSEDRSNGPGDRAQVSVSANVAGLSVGTHTGLLQIVSGTAENSPQTVTVRLTVIGAEADWGVAGPGRSARIETPDGSAQLAVPADAASAAVEIRLTRLDVSTLADGPAESGRVVLAVELDTFDADTGVLKPTDYSSDVTLRLRLSEDDGAACGAGRAQVYRVSDGGRWTLLTHRCETDDSGRVWAVAALTNFSRYVLTIGGTPAAPVTTPTPRPAATPTPAPAVTATPAPVTTPTPAPVTTATPRPVTTATPRPVTTATPRPAATATPRPVTTATPRPAATATPAPVRTATPAPVRTATPAPVRTPTPAPVTTATPTPAPTATPAPVAAALATPTPAPTAAPTAQTEDGEDRGGGGGALWLILGGLLAAIAVATAGAVLYLRLYRKPQGLTPPTNPGQA